MERLMEGVVSIQADSFRCKSNSRTTTGDDLSLIQAP